MTSLAPTNLKRFLPGPAYVRLQTLLPCVPLPGLSNPSQDKSPHAITATYHLRYGLGRSPSESETPGDTKRNDPNF